MQDEVIRKEVIAIRKEIRKLLRAFLLFPYEEWEEMDAGTILMETILGVVRNKEVEEEERKAQSAIRNLLEAVLEKNEEKAREALEEINRWKFQRWEMGILELNSSDSSCWKVEFSDTTPPPTYLDSLKEFFRKEIRESPLEEVARELLKEEETEEEKEERQMVTIKQVAIESGKNESTVRNRIHKARKRGIFKRWEKQGGTVLVDKEEALKIACSVGEPFGRMGRPPKTR